MPKEISPHIKIVKAEEYVRIFHLTEPLTISTESTYPFGEMKEDEFMDDDPPLSSSDESFETKAVILMESLLMIKGVVGGFLKRYTVTVIIGNAFEQDEVYPYVLYEIVRTVFPQTIGKEIEISVALPEENEDDQKNQREKVLVKRKKIEIKTGEKFIDVEDLFFEKISPSKKGVSSKKKEEAKKLD